MEVVSTDQGHAGPSPCEPISISINKAVWCAVSMIRSKPDASLDTIPEDDRRRPGSCQPGMLAEQAYIHLPAVRALTQGAWLSRRRYICQQYGFDPAAQSHSSSTIALVSFSRKQFANIGCFGAALKLGLALVGCLRGGRWRVRGGRWLVPVAILWLLGKQDGDGEFLSREAPQ